MKRKVNRIGSVVRQLAITSCVALALVGGPATAKEIIKLGFIGPLSGGDALQGIGARNAFLLAIRQANSGDYPYKVEPMALDDASKPSVGVSAALKIVNDPEAVAAIGHWNSPVALATIPIFARSNMPFIVWGAISPKITEQNYPNVTRVTPTLAQENQPLAKWLVEGLGYDKIAILTTTDDYGQHNLKSFRKYAEQYGAEIVGAASLPPNTTNFKTVLRKLKRKNPDVLYFGGVIAPAGLARNQMDSIGFDVPLAGISGVFDQKYIDIAGAEAAEGSVVSVPAVEENPKLKALHEAYAKASFDSPHGPYAKYSYDATRILLKVIREHGIDDPAELAQAIRDIRYDGVLGITTFDETGQTKVEIRAAHYVVQDGEWVPYDESSYAGTQSQADDAS